MDYVLAVLFMGVGVVYLATKFEWADEQITLYTEREWSRKKGTLHDSFVIFGAAMQAVGYVAIGAVIVGLLGKFGFMLGGLIG